MALAAVAVIGYLVGHRRRKKVEEGETQSRRELKRAQAVAKELEKIAELVRRHLATHHASVVRFKNRMLTLGEEHSEAAWQELCKESEGMLKPTLKLAAQLANAYDEIRQQSNHLMTFTEVRTDPLTGVSNRRALDETLVTMFAMMSRYEAPFSLVIIDIDHFKKINDEQGHLYGDSILKSVAKLLADTVRETDVVTRYGGEEFVIVMPQTPLAGACMFSDRLRENDRAQFTADHQWRSRRRGGWRQFANGPGASRRRAVQCQGRRPKSRVLPHGLGNSADRRRQRSNRKFSRTDG